MDWDGASRIAADQRATITKEPFTASRTSSPRLQFSKAALRIEVQGSVVDRVRQVGQPLSVKSRPHSAMYERLVWNGLEMQANDGWNLQSVAENNDAAVEVFASWVDLASSGVKSRGRFIALGSQAIVLALVGSSHPRHCNGHLHFQVHLRQNCGRTSHSPKSLDQGLSLRSWLRAGKIVWSSQRRTRLGLFRIEQTPETWLRSSQVCSCQPSSGQRPSDDSVCATYTYSRPYGRWNWLEAAAVSLSSI
ncbi:hypothetical protein CCMA1212_005195 [Trichoderma ghanense]|uniref:Uncharacterized protein n=1 Tax=Trichoderma ghanense TaxID=65468 RepID=A0ABY2H5I2_9HYPO